MRRISAVSAAVLLSTVAMAADAQSPTIFGITLMQPMPLPECSSKPEAVRKFRKAYEKYQNKITLWFPYEAAKTGPCYERMTAKAGTDAPLFDEGISVDFPMSQLPDGAKWDGVSATIIDGKVQGVTFLTYGYNSQTLVLDQLKAKFGEPTIFKPVKKQNGYGATFESIEAVWSPGNGITITFEGTLSRTDVGLVQVQTQAARNRLKASLEPLDSGTPM